ncbi:MAG: hypothetical protein J3T61_00795 [Candidatus Brocadiales bacterium]|nr:hypothetical protein [Candidatus Bathyanammoxibius sp.]
MNTWLVAMPGVWQFSILANGHTIVWYSREDKHELVRGDGPTPAAALVTAAYKALINE